MERIESASIRKLFALLAACASEPMPLQLTVSELISQSEACELWLEVNKYFFISSYAKAIQNALSGLNLPQLRNKTVEQQYAIYGKLQELKKIVADSMRNFNKGDFEETAVIYEDWFLKLKLPEFLTDDKILAYFSYLEPLIDVAYAKKTITESFYAGHKSFSISCYEFLITRAVAATHTKLKNEYIGKIKGIDPRHPLVKRDELQNIIFAKFKDTDIARINQEKKDALDAVKSELDDLIQRKKSSARYNYKWCYSRDDFKEKGYYTGLFLLPTIFIIGIFSEKQISFEIFFFEILFPTIVFIFIGGGVGWLCGLISYLIANPIMQKRGAQNAYTMTTADEYELREHKAKLQNTERDFDKKIKNLDPIIWKRIFALSDEKLLVALQK